MLAEKQSILETKNTAIGQNKELIAELKTKLQKYNREVSKSKSREWKNLLTGICLQIPQEGFGVTSSTPKADASEFPSHSALEDPFSKEISSLRTSLSRRGTVEFVKPGNLTFKKSNFIAPGLISKRPMQHHVPETPNRKSSPASEDEFSARYLVTPCNIPVENKKRKTETGNEITGRQFYGSKRSRTRRGPKHI